MRLHQLPYRLYILAAVSCMEFFFTNCGNPALEEILLFLPKLLVTPGSKMVVFSLKAPEYGRMDQGYDQRQQQSRG